MLRNSWKHTVLNFELTFLIPWRKKIIFYHSERNVQIMGARIKYSSAELHISSQPLSNVRRSIWAYEVLKNKGRLSKYEGCSNDAFPWSVNTTCRRLANTCVRVHWQQSTGLCYTTGYPEQTETTWHSWIPASICSGNITKLKRCQNSTAVIHSAHQKIHASSHWSNTLVKAHQCYGTLGPLKPANRYRACSQREPFPASF